MKFLFILLLFTISCTDKKQTTTISNDHNIEPTVLYYDDSLDLMLIDTTQYLSEDNISCYGSLYQDLKTGQHYLASLSITNNISYTFDSNNISYYLADSDYHNLPGNSDEIELSDYSEKQFNRQQREYFVYIGNLSKFQRVYKNKWGNELYVKTLTPFKDEYYMEVISYKDKTYITNELTTPIFPYSINEDGSYGITYYTNTDGITFSRDWDLYKSKDSLLLIQF